MGLYSKYVLPRLLDFACRNKDVSDLRRQVLPAARGIVVEVGIGSALNLPYYSFDVTHLYGIDSSAELLQMAQKKTAAAPFPVTLLNQTAEKFSLEDHSADTVVMTWVLCSIADSRVALNEARRVLKRDGRLIFLEHGLSPDPKVQSMQNRLTPMWKRLAGGCCLNKKIDGLISQGGFAIKDLQNCHIPGPKAMTYVYRGYAQPE
ncbi:MAG: class I SAM-dependent methyltransferase [Acidobacteriia bacterium]|nr:class I SAM-dependent methyltransferase [Terriglobia bacterium]